MSTLSREELIALVERTHKDASYADATAAGKTFAEHTKLPTLVAQNLGAGFGQWDFFPDAAEIVDFACGYKPPTNEDEMMALAKAWSADDAANRHTLLNLIGKEILRHELKRVTVPRLSELVEATRATRAIEVRKSLGFDVPAGPAAKPERAPRAPKAAAAPRAALPDGPIKMPKPKFVKPPPAAPKGPARRFTHPKFGEGILEKEEGAGENTKLTIKFAAGSKTLLAHFVTEVPSTG